MYSSSVQTGIEGMAEWGRECAMDFYHCIKRGIEPLVKTVSYIINSHVVVEPLFDLFMSAYINGLKAHHNLQLNRYKSPVDPTTNGIRSAREALAYFRYASDVACDTSRLQEAENISLYSLEKLHHR